MNKWTRISIGVILFLIAIGNILIYMYSYKYRGGIATVSLLMILFGLMVVYVIYAIHWKISDKIEYNGDRKEWVGKYLKKGLFYMSFVLIGFSELYITDVFPKKRVERIMETTPTDFANAIVVKIDSASQRYSGKYYINVIEYNTPNGIIRQDINTKRKCYGIGSIIKVKYSLQYPDMFYYY